MRDLAERIKQYFLSQPLVDAAYLFGSFAKGTDRKGSDIDIAVLFSRDAAKVFCFEQRLKIAGELEDLLGRDVDVVDVRSAPLFLQHQVRKYGKLIFERKRTERIAYEVRSRREYFDFARVLDRRSQAMLDRMGGVQGG